MKKVLQVNIENSGGAFQLIYQAQKILKDNIQFDYYTMGVFKKNDVYRDIIEMGGMVYESELRRNRLVGHLMLPFKFYSFLKKHAYRIIHIHSDSAWKLLIYAIPAKILKIDKIIIHSHSSEINGDHIKLKKMCHNICKGIIKYFATEFCGCSDEAVEWMYGKNDKNVIIINNGVDSEKFKFNENIRNSVRNRLNIGYKCVLGTVGNFSYQKNPEFLINLIEELNKKSNQYILIFVGDGINEDNIKKMVNKRHLEDSVIFYGKTTNVEEILNAFDIFILPSRFEGLPVSGIEAQTNGLPCVFASGITKQVEISNLCKYISLSDSVSEWCRAINSININNDRNNAYQNTVDKNFDIKYTANQLEQLYYVNNGE